MLALYLAVSLVYSFRLKREPIIDVFLLATMFTMRLEVGASSRESRFPPGCWSFQCSCFYLCRWRNDTRKSLAWSH